MCSSSCAMSTKTSTFIKSAYTMGYTLGREAADAGRPNVPLSAKAARKSMQTTCGCEMARIAPRHMARSYRLGFEAGYLDLFASEVAARNVHNSPDVVSIEAARSSRLAHAADCAAPLVVGD